MHAAGRDDLAAGKGPFIALIHSVPSTEAGKASSQVSPSLSAICTSLGVATPGSGSSPASDEARTTSRSNPGLTVK
ncbi:hypothetical protein ACVWWH_000757 [Sinomonas sp. RB5]